ncbi:MAG: hypothetical protein WCK67_05775 [bacterium]
MLINRLKTAFNQTIIINKENNQQKQAIQNHSQPQSDVFKSNIAFTGLPSKLSLDMYYQMTLEYDQRLQAVSGEILYDHPFKNIACSLMFINNVKNALPHLQNKRIIALGRSPVFFTEAAKLMKNGIDDYTYVAFSKGWKCEDGKHYGSMPTEEEVKNYRNYLKTVNMTPKEIIKDSKNGKNTMLVDYIESGNGISSFISVLQDWAKEDNVLDELNNSIEIGVMKLPDVGQRYPEEADVTINDTSFKAIVLTIDKRTLEYLRDENEWGQSYPHTKWNEFTPEESQIYPNEKDEFARYKLMDVMKQVNLLKEPSEIVNKN